MGVVVVVDFQMFTLRSKRKPKKKNCAVLCLKTGVLGKSVLLSEPLLCDSRAGPIANLIVTVYSYSSPNNE